MNRKIAKTLIVVMLILGISTNVVKAVIATASIKASKTEIKQGETFTITMGAESQSGLNALVATIEYDETKLELTEGKVTNTVKWINMGQGKQVNIICNSQEETTTDASIYQMTFKVKEGATVGKTEIKAKSMYVDTNEASDSKVTIPDKTVEITIEEAKTPEMAALTGISVTTPPSKTKYNAGEKFDKTGMIVTAEYSDETAKDVTANVTITPNDELTAAITKVTISYTENGVTKSTTQTITVKGVTEDKDGNEEEEETPENEEDKNTTATNSVPQTGLKDYAIPTLSVVGIITVISIKLYNKYKMF